MIATTLRQLVCRAAPLIVIFALPAGAWAADASPWDGDTRASLRLIAGAPNGDARAGVEIKLNPGWKTYWRYPGDSGVPPRFDFAGSQNVKSIEVAWPAPHGLADDSGTSIGYKNGVIFPLRVVPENRGRPVLLRVKLEYGVCE